MFINSQKSSIFLLFVSNIVAGKRTDSVNKCEQCKVLTDSFAYWLDKTSRGKFEGGDVAWEESKLKSYSRSELRLVEIGEGLCSELKKHKDSCYSLAENTESYIDKWWMLDSQQSADLYTWLCIETLQRCCPAHQFGPECRPCLGVVDKVVCGGNGKCDGEGTRDGNGTCICNKGYKGDLCGECSKNFYRYNSACEPCHSACNECTNYGVNYCIECVSGWQMESGKCIDINECAEMSLCKENEYCINTEGSYNCKLCDKTCKTCIGKGPSNCSTCKSNSVLWNGKCIDDKVKREILKETLQRVAIHIIVMLIACFVFRNSVILSSITVAIVSSNIYFTEKSAEFNVLDVIFYMFIN